MESFKLDSHAELIITRPLGHSGATVVYLVWRDAEGWDCGVRLANIEGENRNTCDLLHLQCEC